MKCYNCGEQGHYQRNCPALLPGTTEAVDWHVTNYAEHLARIDQHVTDWQAGKTGTDEKRQVISDENRAYYGDGVRRALTWP